MIKDNTSLSRFLTPVLDDDTRAANNLSGVAVSVNLAETSPLTKLLSIRNLDDGDRLSGLVRKSLDQSSVGLFGDGLAQNAELGLTRRESLGSLSETSSKTVVDQSLLEDTSQGIFNGDTAGGGSNFNDFFDLGDFFSIRLNGQVSIS